MQTLRTVILFFLVCQTTLSADIQLETDSVSKDYATELPRIAPTEPQDALNSFQLVPGFRIEHVVHEPLLTDPIAMAFDERGRLFVVSMRGYSENDDDNLGLVRLLEDTDGDGTFDRGTNFVEGLSWPTAIACFDDGILLAVSPDILFLRDTNNDGIADERRVVLTGFGRSNVQGMINSFRWGLNNRLFGATGTIGAAVHRVDPKTQKRSGTVSLRGRDFSFDPIDLTFEPEAGGAQHGATFDRWGERYVCSNSDHIQWIRFDDRHARRSSALDGVQTRKSIAVDGPSAEVYRKSNVEPWRIVRTRLRVKGMVGGPVEGGGRASGYFTSASGITAYTGDAFPEPYRSGNYAFVGDVGSNLVHLKRIETVGLEKRAIRATPDETEFLTSTDNWFRPVQFGNGPDGALYILDMYREVIEHPRSLPPMIKKHLDLTSGRSRGRIYRIVPTNWNRPNRMLPGQATPLELVQMLGHENGWHRETAARLIVSQCKQSHNVADRFAGLLRQACKTDSPNGRIRALYCLQAIEQLSESTIVRQLSDSHPEVRRHALIVVEKASNIGEATISQLNAMVDDADINVRYQLALTLGTTDWDSRKHALTMLANEAKHERMRLALLSSIGTNRLAMLRELLANAEKDHVSELLDQIVGQIGREQQDCGKCLKLLRISSDSDFRLVATLLMSTGMGIAELDDLLTSQGVAGASDSLNSTLDRAHEIAISSDLSLAERVFALKLLSIGEYTQVRSILTKLLSPKQPAVIRDAAVDAFERFHSPEAANQLLNSTRSLGPTGSRRAFDLFVSRTSWAKLLLDAIEKEDLTPTAISARQRDRLLRNRDNDVSERARQLLGSISDRGKTVTQFQHVLSRTGDVKTGRALFRKVCSSCHRVEEFGANIGPNLEPLRNRGAAFMLTNILDPNREVDPRYMAYQVVTIDGLSFVGLLTSDSATAVTLLQADNKSVSIAKDKIDIIESTGRSLMPEGMERDLGAQGIADVIAYLIDQTQDDSTK